MAPAARERRPLASSPGGGRHRCAKRSERRVRGSRPDDAERRGTGREASHSGTRGPSRPPAFGGLCRAPPGELPRGRRSPACASLCMVAWVPRLAPSRELHFHARRGVRADRSWPVLPVGAGTAARSAAKGVYYAAVRMMLNAGVPAEGRTTRRTRGPSLPPACGGLCRAPPGELPRGRRSKPSPRFTWTEYGSFAALRAAMPV